MKITVYGGVEEIGGNTILLEDEGASILLDFGISYRQRDRFFSDPFLSPRSVESLMNLGILPPVPEFYCRRGVDAVFITHPHRDHSSYISFLDRSIPVYLGDTTRTILESWKTTKRRFLEFNLEGIKFHTFRSRDVLKDDPLVIHPMHVDHSIPGSYGYVIETPSGVVGYTGDFRMHGERPDLTRDFIKLCKKKNVDILITEATNILDGKVSGENDVKRSLIEVLKRAEGAVIVEYSKNDIDRLRSVYEASKRTGRKLVISVHQAHLLMSLRNDPHLKLPPLGELYVLERDRKIKPPPWIQQILNTFRSIDMQEISPKQKEYTISLSFYELEELFHLSPAEGSIYILSSSEPFTEEMEIDFERLKNWLNHFGVPLYQTHASGHIMPQDLRKVVKEISPKKVIPVHTEHPELVKRYLRDLCEVILPEKGKPITFY